MRVAATHVAEFLGVQPADLVFVDNITAGANAVLRSFPFVAGDEILVTNLGYGAVTYTAEYVARSVGATVRSIDLPWPGAASSDFVDAIVAGLRPQTRLAIVDHITAETALVLPIAEIIRACRERGVLVLVDGAHTAGNVPLDIAALDADWYTGNLHKWAWAPRSSGFLWAAPQHHGTLHPTVISWGLDHGLAAEFDLLGTRDPTPWLIAPMAIDLLREYGLDDVFAYNHDLAWWAGNHLAEQWGTVFATPESMIGAMVNVTLPQRLHDREPGDVQSALRAAGIEVPVFAHPHGLTVRVSVQVYVDRSDIQRLSDSVLAL
jgi:isopenicillin-N epimerase